MKHHRLVTSQQHTVAIQGNPIWTFAALVAQVSCPRASWYRHDGHMQLPCSATQHCRPYDATVGPKQPFLRSLPSPLPHVFPFSPVCSAPYSCLRSPEGPSPGVATCDQPERGNTVIYPVHACNERLPSPSTTPAVLGRTHGLDETLVLPLCPRCHPLTQVSGWACRSLWGR